MFLLYFVPACLLYSSFSYQATPTSSDQCERSIVEFSVLTMSDFEKWMPSALYHESLTALSFAPSSKSRYSQNLHTREKQPLPIPCHTPQRPRRPNFWLEEYLLLISMNGGSQLCTGFPADGTAFLLLLFLSFWYKKNLNRKFALPIRLDLAATIKGVHIAVCMKLMSASHSKNDFVTFPSSKPR